MDIDLVLPTTASSHHSLILALLERRGVHPSTARHTKVPVIPSPDVTAALQRNERNSKRRKTTLAKNPGGEPPLGADLDEEMAGQRENAGAHAENGPESVGDNESEAADEAENFVPLAAFQPESRLQQVTTAFYPRFPMLKKQHVSTVFRLFLAQCPHAGATATFSFLESAADDSRGIYVRFPTVAIAQWVLQNSARVFDSKAVFDSELASLGKAPGKKEENEEPEEEKKEPGEEKKEPEEEMKSEKEAKEEETQGNFSQVKKEVVAIFRNRRNYLSAKANTKDLDAVMEYYRTYKVQNLDLVEVPKEMKDAIVQDIIRFRSRVLLLERENRKKEIEKERRAAKRRLTQIYDSIRKRDEKEEGESGAAKEEEVSDKSERESGESAFSALSDEEYENLLAKNAAEALEAEYTKKCRRILQEESQKAALLVTLSELYSYEDDLLENKLSFMDALKMMETGAPQNVPANLALLALYHTNPREYARVRNLERSKEESWEAEEREREKEKKKGEKEQKAKETEEREEKEKGEMEKSEKDEKDDVMREVGGLLAENLSLIKTHISSLIEDYLGIREEILITYIYEHILKHNLEKREELVAELAETLDDDAEIVVDLLYDYVKNL